MASINGFTVSSNPGAIGVRSFRVPGTQVSLPVRSEIAPLLIGLAAEFHRTVEPLVRGWNWGYAFRPVTGGGSYSFHAAGIAIDLNAPRHPYGRSNTFNAGDQARCRALARKYGCRWGGDYRTTKDDMHFEVILPRSSALALVRRLQTPPSAPLAGPVLRQGSTGEQVKRWQRGLGVCGFRVAVDGAFGPGTAAATKRFQAACRLSADGIVGPRSWSEMLRRVRI